MLQTVDFETTTGYTLTGAQTSIIPGSDWWERALLSEVAPDNPLSGYQGSYFFYAEDTDNERTIDDPVYCTLNSVATTGYSNLTIKLLVAGNNSTNSNYEQEEYLRIQYAFDGGSFVTLSQFIASAPNVTFMSEDADADGITDGVGLSPAFAEFTYSIPNVGSSLQVRIMANIDQGREEVAFDNIRISGTPAGNAAPTASGFSTSTGPYQNQVYTFSTSDFGYADGDSDPIDHIRVTAVSVNGTLYVDADNGDDYDNGEELSNGGTISKADLDAGNLQYYTTTSISSSFTFDVNDGTDYSSSTYTATLNVIGLPTVSTTAISTFDATSATLGGEVTSDGGATVSERGIVYNTTGTPSILSDTKVSISSGTGIFSQSVSSLSPGITYYVRAYAINSVGTSYGGVKNFTTPKQSQTITFTPLSAVTYGNSDVNPGATASSTLSVTYSSSNTSVASIVNGQIHIVGAGSCTIYADQPGNATYNAATQISQGLTVNKATPTVTVWPAATGITYGENLSLATLSGGTASVAGSFAYDDNTITPNAGTYSADLTFTPTNASNYNTVAENINVTVAKATPTVTVWPAATGITYGENLSLATLSGGTASVAGSFAYDDNTITPNAGTYSADLTFTPTNASNYNTVAENINVTVAKATPTVTVWPAATGITYGENLSLATLSGGTASVAGSFAYDDNTITPNAGTYSADLTFTPTNASNYNTVAENINVTVAKATPTVTVWPAATGITYGENLSLATLSGGTASVAGSFAYDDNTITPNAGTYSADLTFTPTNASNYNTVAENINVTVAKATPTVTVWPAATGITYGENLSLATLSGGTASVAGSFAYDDNTITPNAGTYSADLTFTPTNASNYNTVAENINVTVAKATPTVTVWPAATGITYGENLSLATLSGGTASVAGSFAYDDNTITPNAGTYSADLTFTPTNASNYNTVAENINVTVAKATPTVTVWPAATGITYGENLSLATLSGGTASVAGSFAYDDNTITPNAGTYSADLTFTPTNASNYNTVAENINVTVAKATPTVTVWPAATGITYGENLSLATLSGGTASVAGSFAYDDNTITPNAGTYSADLTFTPTNASNYNTVAENINVTVAKATPTVTVWPAATGITYGENLSLATLSGGTASVAGSFAYDDNTITPNAGTYSADLTFTPTNASNYNTVAENINVTVAKATPTVTVWPAATGITYGENLSLATLSGGTASVAGSFAYDDNTITPNAGTYSADLTFTPTNASNYNTVAENINVTVAKATPTVTVWPAATGITYGENLSLATLSGGTASVAGSFAYDDNTITPNAGTYSADLTFTPTNASNYNTVAENINVTVAKATPTVTVWPAATGITYGENLSLATLSGGTASVAGSFAYDDNTITPNAGTYSADLTFTPTNASNYNTVAENINVTVAKATPTVTVWPAATGITYGENLSLATLSGGTASVAGSFAYDDNTITPNAGTYSADLTFTPTNASNYNTVAENINVTVAKATPTVTVWPAATGITYGENLSLATLSGGTASVAGSFAYDDNTITPNAGTYSADLTFTPTNASNYNTVAENINVTVAKATPTVTVWPAATGITYGENLSLATLNGGTASVAGSFAYDDNTITPNAGTYSTDLTFTPTNASNYNTVAENINVAVAKASLSATADDKVKNYGETNPVFTVAYSGFVGTDNETDLDTPPTAQCTAKQSSNVGNYQITVSGGTDNNYTFSYFDGTLTIDATTSITPTINTFKSAWPNPTSGLINIDKNFCAKVYKIYNITGSMVSNGKVINSIIDISDLDNGIYIIKINNTTYRIIKE
ncbi:beta strand repeat-containing protein [Labilibaculum euxinus]